MRFLITLIAIIILLIPVQMIAPWWSLAIVALVAGVLSGLRPGWAFAVGALGCGLVWWGAALYIHMQTNGILSEPIAALLKVKSPFLLIILTGLIAAIVGGFASLSGRQLRYSLSETQK